VYRHYRTFWLVLSTARITETKTLGYSLSVSQHRTAVGAVQICTEATASSDSPAAAPTVISETRLCRTSVALQHWNWQPNLLQPSKNTEYADNSSPKMILFKAKDTKGKGADACFIVN